jgi:hypothetical protein
MRIGAYGMMIVFGLFWSGMTLLFDSLTVVPAVRQLRALSFPSVPGTIISSEIKSRDDGDGGTTTDVAMRYGFVVDDREYSGDRYRYGGFSSSDCGWAQGVVARYPAGAKATVYYNPSNPEDSVLSRGLFGSDLFMVAFMTPFNIVMLGFWAAGWAHLRRRWGHREAGGVRIARDLRQVRARLTQFSAVTTALMTLGLLSFLSIFVVGFFAGGFHPPLRTMLITWTTILSGAVLAGVWHAAKIFSGKYDLVIDDLGASLELPATCGRKQRQRVAFNSVRQVNVETIEKSSSDGESSAKSYAVTIDLAGAQPSTHRLVEWYDSAKADAFAAWLRAQLRRG